MILTTEYLLDLRQKAEERRQALLGQVQQAAGAIAMIDVMLHRLRAPEPQAKEGSDA